MNDERGTMKRTMNDERGSMNERTAHRSSFIDHRSKQRGFTLIELIVVVTIVGIMAGVAVVNVRFGQRKAREAALKDNLHTMRAAIDTFYADKQRYPADLNELVPDYLKKIPTDPITNTAEWEEVVDTPDPDAPESTDAEGNPVQPGVSDVRSRAPGVTLDNVAFTEL